MKVLYLWKSIICQWLNIGNKNVLRRETVNRFRFWKPTWADHEIGWKASQNSRFCWRLVLQLHLLSICQSQRNCSRLISSGDQSDASLGLQHRFLSANQHQRYILIFLETLRNGHLVEPFNGYPSRTIATVRCSAVTVQP